MQNDTKLMERAVKSGNLQERSRGNQQYGSADFGAWTNRQIDSLKFRSVLDICCGTGNQLALYGNRPEVESMVGVDLSRESLQIAGERLDGLKFTGDSELLHCPMEDMFLSDSLKPKTFDLISCFYGLYYANDVTTLLGQMMDHLTARGTILIVGPYGANNASIFSLLTKYFELPELVTRSASTFMEEEVVPCLKEKADLKIETFVNQIKYPTPALVMDYWQASTFYSDEFHDEVQADIEEKFRAQGSFVIEKHVMACLASKKQNG